MDRSVAGNGGTDHWRSNDAGGGGGAGGSILLKFQTASLGQVISHRQVWSRQGMRNMGQGSNGGNGGFGRLHIDYCDTLSGSTNPPADSTRLSCYIAEQTEDSSLHNHTSQTARKLQKWHDVPGAVRASVWCLVHPGSRRQFLRLPGSALGHRYAGRADQRGGYGQPDLPAGYWQ